MHAHPLRARGRLGRAAAPLSALATALVLGGLGLGALSCASGERALAAPDERRRVSASEARPEAPWRSVPIGLCEDYPEETRSVAQVERDFEALKGMGVSSLRISVGWDGIEPEDDQFDLAFLDEVVALAEQHGVTLLPYVCYTPTWAAREPGETYKSPPADPAEFAEVMQVLAERYEGRIRTWELWNEPDNAAYWSGSAADYAALLRAGAAAVHRVDPGLQVVLGGIAWDLEFLRQVFEEPGAAEAADVVNLHAYFETWSGQPLERLTAFVNEARDLVRTEGRGQPLWMAEVGYSSFRSGAHVSDQYKARFDYEHTADYQAQALVRTAAMLLATGVVERVAWYELRDLPPQEDVIGDVNNRHLGVLTVDRKPKPAYQALAFLQDLLGAPHRGLDREVRVTAALGSDAEVHAFEREDGQVIVTAWIRTSVPGRRSADAAGSEAGDAEDPRRERLDLFVPRALDAKVQRLDARGRPQGELRAQPTDGGVNVADVEVRAGETVVLVLEPAAAPPR